MGAQEAAVARPEWTFFLDVDGVCVDFVFGALRVYDRLARVVQETVQACVAQMGALE